MDQGSNKNHSPAYNFTPTVTKFCVMWECLSLPLDTKFGNCRCKIVDSRSFHSWSLIHGLRWSGLIKVGPVQCPGTAWTNAGILSIGFLLKYFKEIWIGMLSIPFMNCNWKCCLPKWQSFCPGGDELSSTMSYGVPKGLVTNTVMTALDYKLVRSNWYNGSQPRCLNQGSV